MAMNPKAPSRFDELLAEGQALAKEEQVALLQELAQNSRQFPALLALVRSHWMEYGKSISDHKLAAHHGSVEHCAGAMHAMQTLENVLRGLVRGPKPVNRE